MSERYYEPTYEELKEKLKEVNDELRREKEIAKMNSVGEKWKTERIKVLENIISKLKTEIITLRQKNKELENALIHKEEKKEKNNIPLFLLIIFWCLIPLASYFVCLFLWAGFDGEEPILVFLGFILLVSTVFTIHLNVKFTLKRIQRTVIYKEKCYKKINRIHSFYESGAITEEEFNKLKQEILRKIK